MYGITPSSRTSGLIGRRGSTIIHGNSNTPPLARATITFKAIKVQILKKQSLNNVLYLNGSHVPIICLLVIPFSVIVSRMDSIAAGKMKACLSTIGNLVVVKDENTKMAENNYVNDIPYGRNRRVDKERTMGVGTCGITLYFSFVKF